MINESISYLKSRSYKGNLLFDHENQKLDVIVQPNKSKEVAESKDLKSLSGGERSFSTVAFLLSLWSIVESPILFLDEFDVFMVGAVLVTSFHFKLILKKSSNHFCCFVSTNRARATMQDQINRSFAMELILSAAKDNLNGQYVFLTPQEMG